MLNRVKHLERRLDSSLSLRMTAFFACHAERSEASSFHYVIEILRFAQNDNTLHIIYEAILCLHYDK